MPSMGLIEKCSNTLIKTSDIHIQQDKIKLDVLLGFKVFLEKLGYKVQIKLPTVQVTVRRLCLTTKDKQNKALDRT